MLEIYLPESEYYDEKTESFYTKEAYKFELEHSLRSLSKWEEKYKVPLMETEMTEEQLKYYIKCMSINGDISDEHINRLDINNYKKIKEYMADSHTATTITNRDKSSHKKEIITAEVLYYWMISMEIPFECETWHLNKLLTLIRVCGVKNNPKKMNQKESMMEYMRRNKLRKGMK